MITLWTAAAFAQETQDAPAPAEPAAPSAEPSAEPAPEVEPEVAPEPAPADAPAPDPIDAEQAGVAEPAEPVPATEVALAPDYRSELRYGLGLEIGTVNNGDPAYDWFSAGNSIDSFGVRAGIRPAAWLQARVGWHSARRGITVWSTDGSTADFTNDNSSFRTSLSSHQFMAGARVDAAYDNTLYGYAAADALLYVGRMRFDDDPSIDSNPGQVQAWGAAPGVAGLVGAELRLPPGITPVQVGWSVELGYTYYAAAQFEGLGPMKPGGFTVRSGPSVWF